MSERRESGRMVLLPCEDPDGEEIGLAECRYIELYHGQKRCEGCPLNDKDVEIAAEIAVEHHCNVEDEKEAEELEFEMEADAYEPIF